MHVTKYIQNFYFTVNELLTGKENGCNADDIKKWL